MRWMGSHCLLSVAGPYLAHITSYDYDCPISEGGEHGYGPDGDKFEAIKQVRAASALMLKPRHWPRAALCLNACDHTAHDFPQSLKPVTSPFPRVAWLQVVAQFAPYAVPAEPPLPPRRSFGAIRFDAKDSIPLLAHVDELRQGPEVQSDEPGTMESYGQGYGFILYR
jgi:hypothetical protein